MGIPSTSPDAQTRSALQSLIDTYPIPPNAQPHLYHLALQIAHNLHFQHRWTDICIHHGSNQPRPMISGLPPKRLYVHPDEQIELLQQQKAEGKSGMPELGREREWVLSSHLRERWTLRRFGEVFGEIGPVPSSNDGELLFDDTISMAGPGEKPESDLEIGESDTSLGDGSQNKWRLSQPKRLLLATLDDDSTIVYYIVHDGIVKPRQN